MAFDFGSLGTPIREILSAPGTDLSTISAKRVRRQLLELVPSLTPEFLRDNKDEVDAVIAGVFEQVSGGEGAEAVAEETPAKSRKRKQEPDDVDEVPDEEDDDEAAASTPPPKKAKKAKNGRELSDAALARKLSSEINGRSTRTGTKGRGAAATPKKGARAKKSAATIDSDDDSDSGPKPKKKPKKAAGSTGAKGGFAKEFALR